MAKQIHVLVSANINPDDNDIECDRAELNIARKYYKKKGKGRWETTILGGFSDMVTYTGIDWYNRRLSLEYNNI